MATVLFVFLVFVVVAAAAVAWAVGTYNVLIGLRNEIRNQRAQIDVQLKRRHDLIPNLVEPVRGYATHEYRTLEAVIRARQQVVTLAANAPDRAQLEDGLSRALRSHFAVAERYPELKADHQFQALQEVLTSTEDKVGYARQYYNDAVMRLNNRIAMFPGSLIAGTFGFREEDFCVLADATAGLVPVVQL